MSDTTPQTQLSLVDPVRAALQQTRHDSTVLAEEIARADAARDVAMPSEALMRAVEDPEYEFLVQLSRNPEARREMENLPQLTLPWERFPAEPKSAWIAFQEYLALGPRRGASQSTLAAMWNWEWRARMWDEYNLFVKHREELAAHAEISRRQIMIARALQTRGLEALSQIDPYELKGADIIRMIVQGLEEERKAVTFPQEAGNAGSRKNANGLQDNNVTVNVNQQMVAPQMSPEALKLMLARERIVEVTDVTPDIDDDA